MRRLSDGIFLRIVAEPQRDKLEDLAAALAGMSAGERAAPAPAREVAPADQSEAEIDDDAAAAPDPDDLVVAPAPDASVFAPKRRTTDLLAEQRLRTQRTAIPILLTCGLLLPAVGSLKWLAPRDSIFAQWDLAMPVILAVVGLMLLGVAAINMLHVRDTLRRPGRK